jgi:hypothetical protein
MKYLFEKHDIVPNLKVKVAGIGLITVIEVHKSLTTGKFGDEMKYSAVRDDAGLMMFPVTTAAELAKWFTGNQGIPQLNWQDVDTEIVYTDRRKGIVE